MKVFPTTLLLVSLLVLTTGCRTYGGHDTEQATYDQIQKTNQQFSEALNKAEAELDLLQRAAASESALAPFVSDYQALIDHHGMLVEEHAALAANVSVIGGMMGRLTTSYRDLNRVLGTIGSEQKEMKIAYELFLNNLRATLDGVAAPTVQDVSRYQVAPPYYEQVRHALGRSSLRDAIN